MDVDYHSRFLFYLYFLWGWGRVNVAGLHIYRSCLKGIACCCPPTFDPNNTEMRELPCHKGGRKINEESWLLCHCWCHFHPPSTEADSWFLWGDDQSPQILLVLSSRFISKWKQLAGDRLTYRPCRQWCTSGSFRRH